MVYTRRMNISDDYYDLETYNLVLNTLTDEDKEMLQSKNESLALFLVRRWRTIINSFPENYYNQYSSKTTPQDRNEWFKKYLDYPTKDISQMPEIL